MKKFNKKEMSEILFKIVKSYKSQNEFARISNVNSGYISKLINYKIDKAPGIEILNRIADNSNDMVTFMELLKICGYIEKVPDECANMYIHLANGDTTECITPEEWEQLKSILKIIRDKK